MLQKTPLVVLLLSLSTGTLPAHNAPVVSFAEPTCCLIVECLQPFPEASGPGDCSYEAPPASPSLLAQIGPNQAAAIVWQVTGLPVLHVQHDGNGFRVTVQTASGAYLTFCVDATGNVWQC